MQIIPMIVKKSLQMMFLWLRRGLIDFGGSDAGHTRDYRKGSDGSSGSLMEIIPMIVKKSLHILSSCIRRGLIDFIGV